MEKRGQSHIEFILSFLIFIAAVSFAVYFFNPSYKASIADSTLSYTDNAIKDKLKTELDIYYIKTDNTNDFSTLGLDLGNNKTRVEDYKMGNQINFGASGSNICIENQKADIVAIYASPDIIDSSSSINCPSGLGMGTATISSVIKEDVISEKKANATVSEYNNDYNKLKNELNIPASRDFNFGIIFSSDDKIEPTKRQAPRGVNVYAKSESLEVLRANGERKFGEVYVQIW